MKKKAFDILIFYYFLWIGNIREQFSKKIQGMSEDCIFFFLKIKSALSS